ncbi:methylthioribulose 1-phosphate dehydratase [Oryzibacter oryziterrae]|uniref:methylthioribulose 1-phosphate dehydratase n=1 Tax=Oryzibacter oryziterrae TaxID=2766474 RepID=UPI001F005EC5|nr:methylthioribulose 1-phosphate dehydratase [Oryzibacter oryziterrae]
MSVLAREVALPGSAEAVAQVIEAGRAASARGWVPATSGNFSVRIDAEHIAVTRSGVDKGALTPKDVLIQNITEPLVPRSSAEAGLHTRLYADNPGIGAIFHAHAPAASVLGRRHEAAGRVLIEGWELQKALKGVTSHETVVEVPVFANDQDIAALADRVATRLAVPAEAARFAAPGYLLAGHGLYAWGAGADDAFRHLEALEVLFNQLILFRSYQP